MSKSTIHLVVDSGSKQGETLDRKPGSVIRIGRVVKGNTLAIKDPSISQKHLVIEFDPQTYRWALRDLDTSNGTFVNGERVPSSTAVHLSDGDSIRVGECSFVSVKISVIEENVKGTKTNAGKKGRGTSIRSDDFEDVEGLLNKDEILDSGVESRIEVTAKNSKRERKRGLHDSNSLGSGLGAETEATNLGRGRRRNPIRGLQENKTLGASVDDRTDVPMNLRKSGNANDCENTKDRNSKGASKKDENSDAAMHNGAKDASQHLGKGRKQNSTRGLKKVEIMESAVGNTIEEQQNLEERNPVVSNKDKIPENVVEDKIKASENLGKGRRRTSVKFLETDGIIKDNVTVAKNLDGRRRTRSSTQLLEKDPSTHAVVQGKAKKLENFGKHRGESSASNFMRNEILEPSVKTSVEGQKSLRRGRKSIMNPVPKQDNVLGDIIDVPKTIRRGRKSILNPVPKQDNVLGDIIDVPKTTRRGRKSILNPVPKQDNVLGDIIDVPKTLRGGRRTSIEAQQSLGRGRKSILSPVPKKDKVLGDIIEVPKTIRGGRRTRSTNVSEKDHILDLIAEDKIPVHKNAGRWKRASSIGVSKLDEIAESITEDRTEAPKRLARGKRMANSSKLSKIVDASNIVMKDAVEAEKDGQRGNRRRAPARRTRASSRVSADEQLHQPARSNLKDKVLNPVENLRHWKKTTEGSNQLGQSEKVKQRPHISSPPGGSKDKCQIREDKENYVSSKCRRIDSEIRSNSFYKRNLDEERPIFGSIDTQSNKPSRVFPKAWNGNGIPNTTSKYKEDSKVSWHATPFEERLEKALSDEKIFPQRTLTN